MQVAWRRHLAVRLPQDVASMITIRVVGRAVVFDLRGEDEAAVVEDESLLKTLHGLEHNEVFADYLGDGGYRVLVDAGVSGGLLRFEYDAAAKQLYGVTEYTAPRLLTPAELVLLKEYTIGQWSDGIGSNFFQDRMDHGLAPQIRGSDRSKVSVSQRS